MLPKKTTRYIWDSALKYKRYKNNTNNFNNKLYLKKNLINEILQCRTRRT